LEDVAAFKSGWNVLYSTPAPRAEALNPVA
jgi:hypothetical protein